MSKSNADAVFEAFGGDTNATKSSHAEDDIKMVDIKIHASGSVFSDYKEDGRVLYAEIDYFADVGDRFSAGDVIASAEVYDFNIFSSNEYLGNEYIKAGCDGIMKRHLLKKGDRIHPDDVYKMPICVALVKRSA